MDFLRKAPRSHLHEFLGYSWDEVHEEAERLEHFISERLEDRIAAKLGDPEIDPHGHLIPERNGVVPFREEFPDEVWVLFHPLADDEERCHDMGLPQGGKFPLRTLAMWAVVNG